MFPDDIPGTEEHRGATAWGRDGKQQPAAAASPHADAAWSALYNSPLYGGPGDGVGVYGSSGRGYARRPTKERQKWAWTMVRVNDPRRDPASVKGDVRPFCARHDSHAASQARVVVASCSSAGLLADAATHHLCLNGYIYGKPGEQYNARDVAAAAADFAGFTHVFIDEAGQATVPESLIPMRLVSHRTHVLLAGDPRQLAGLRVRFA